MARQLGPPEPADRVRLIVCPATGEASGKGIGEPRWPPVAAVVIFMTLTISLRLWLPTEEPIRAPWVLPMIEAALLAALLVNDPRGRARRTSAMRGISLTLVGLLLAAALWATAFLISDLIRGTGVANLPSHLLATGALVWAGNNLAFALLYWLLDGGGPPARIRRSRPVDFAFTQHINPDLAPPGWRPQFLDYLHLSFTNAMALSPTDVMPLTLRVKYLMIVQSTIALALFGLVVARAVNAFT